MPPAMNSPVTGSIGICPEAKIRLPARTACEYGPMARGARSVAIISFTGGSGSVLTAKTNLYFITNLEKLKNTSGETEDPTTQIGPSLSIGHMARVPLRGPSIRRTKAIRYDNATKAYPRKADRVG